MATTSKICQKRLVGDMKLLKKEPLEFIDAVPDDNNILTWYFLLKGPAYSDYKDGYYIGTIIHSPEYPFKPPDFKMFTPSGRFTTHSKICLSNSSYHSNEWSSMWTIKAILLGFLSIMLDDNEHGISHINTSKEEKKLLAKQSIGYNKLNHLDIIKKFTRFFDQDGNVLSEEEQTNRRKQNDKKNNNKQSPVKESKEHLIKQSPVKESKENLIKQSPVKGSKENLIKKYKINNVDFNNVIFDSHKKNDELYKNLLLQLNIRGK